MPTKLRSRKCTTQRPRRFPLQIESLETRDLLSAPSLPGTGTPPTPPNTTLDQAQPLLGLTQLGGQAVAEGSIAEPQTGVAEVKWYSFTLSKAALVDVTVHPEDGAFNGVISLYNSDQFDFADPYDPTGNRLVEQDRGTGPGQDVTLQRLLSPDNYIVAVSGSGNFYFNPFIADSGALGSGGTFQLSVTAVNLPQQLGDGPVVLTTDPAPGAVLGSSPLALRLALSDALDPNTIAAGSTVTLTYNPAGTFGDGNDQDVPLANVNFTPAADELQLFPAAPLAPGYYRLFLAGDGSNGQPVIADLNGTALGTSSAHTQGNDFVETFQVAGIEGNTGPGAIADDTPAGAHDLGNATAAGLIQVPGAIGIDPAYNWNNQNPLLANAAAQVDLYHFQVTGSGRYALTAEVFAGRIGSPLDPALSLFRLDPSSGQLELVDFNDNTQNSLQVTNQAPPLYTDAALFDGLTQGDYYIAVSGTGNMPDSAQGIDPGTNGVFDPTVSHSGANGFTTGNYVLNVLVQSAPAAPQVVSTTLVPGAVLNAPPTEFSVQFSDAVNLQQLAYNQSQLTGMGQIRAVYFPGPGGPVYPRLLSYDQATNTADFIMLDPLPNGTNVLHLSGALGLTDLAGNPLVGNDPSGDYVVSLTVAGPDRGTGNNPLLWTSQEPNNRPDQPQDLGVLYPDELNSGVTIQRLASGTNPQDTGDYYRFQVLQSRGYFFSIGTSSGLPAGTVPTITDANGNPIFTLGGAAQEATLDPGVYEVYVGGWTANNAGAVSYQLNIALATSLEDPTPLTAGPAPAFRINLTQIANTGGTSNGGGTNSGGGSNNGGGTSNGGGWNNGGGTSSGGTSNGGTSNGGTNNGGGSNNGGSVVIRVDIPSSVTTSTNSDGNSGKVGPFVVNPSGIAGSVTSADPGRANPIGAPSSATGAAQASNPLSSVFSGFSELPVGGTRDVAPVNYQLASDRLAIPSQLGTNAVVSIQASPLGQTNTVGGNEIQPAPGDATQLNPELLRHLEMFQLWLRLNRIVRVLTPDSPPRVEASPAGLSALWGTLFPEGSAQGPVLPENDAPEGFSDEALGPVETTMIAPYSLANLGWIVCLTVAAAWVVKDGKEENQIALNPAAQEAPAYGMS